VIARAQPAATPATPQALARAVILVCDDDRLVLVTLSSALRDAGYEVIEADNGDDAILLARQHRPDLALLDIRMDGKSGLDVASYLRDYVGTPFMFLSAFSDEAFIRKAREFGALDYLVKPIDIERIAPAVEAALGAGRSVAARAEAGDPDTRPDAHPAAATPGGTPAQPLSGAAARHVALGILMERFRLTRLAAEQRLAALAQQAMRPEEAVAEEMVRSVDALNAPGR
jgi:response regulator NasT